MPPLARIGMFLVAFSGSGLCPAQTGPLETVPEGTASQPAEESQAYWLRVTADRVNLHSQADRNTVTVKRVDRDSVLRAVGSEFGWHRVLPPDDLFSYVSARYVDQISHSEGVVSVRSGRLRVRVGSLISDLDPLQSDVQTLLPRGATVRIVGRRGDWLKIVPPEGVYVYVHADHVERITAEVAARLRAAAEARPSTPGMPAAPVTTAPAEPADLSGRWGQLLLSIEAEIAAEGCRPPLQQSWTAAIARLRPIAEQREEPVVARLAERWITRLEERMVDQAALRAARRVAQEGERARTRFEHELEHLRRTRQGAASQPASQRARTNP